MGIQFVKIQIDAHQLVRTGFTYNGKQDVNIHDIKFITNTDRPLLNPNDINIITNSYKRYLCKFDGRKFASIEYMHQIPIKDIITVSSHSFGYVYKDGDKYVMEEYDHYGGFLQLYTVDELPTNFMAPNKIVCNGKLITYKYTSKTVQTLSTDVSHMYNYTHYCTKDDQIYFAKYDNIIKDTSYNKVNITLITHITIQRIFSNISIIVGTLSNHHKFDKYTSNFVKVILKCCRYSVFRKYIPKGVLFMIIQYTI